MQTQGPRARILEAIAASETPLTVAEIVERTQIGAAGVYIEVYRLTNEHKLKKRKRPSKGRGRALAEYFITPPTDARANLEDFKDEIPDHVWWAEQKLHGFKRPRLVHVIYPGDPMASTRV